AESADWHTLEMGTLVAPGAMDDPMFERLLKINDDSVAEIVMQDLHVDLLVQQGLKSKFAPRGRYSWQEGAQRQFNLWLVERYKKAWADKKARRTN
ncbi:MAG TPA: SRPBCC family protein, partial [Alphaproteobacteria bacterium]|nr:SRPBCC family protein [Alphaproteobacteria bacterium]